MCGISAIVDPRRRPSSLSTLNALHAPIRHRGPDGEGFLVLDDAGTRRCGSESELPRQCGVHVGVAFRRLKILDLSPAAEQPMPNHDRTLWIAFNGEIYNFRQIRGELEKRGREFVSTGDTEVALAAFEEWGEEAFQRFDGMWAIIVLDLRQRRLIVSRDRF